MANYHDTHILFDRVNLRIRNKKVFLGTIEQARVHGFLKNIDTFVFLRSDPVAQLIECDAFDKKIYSFTEREFYTPQNTGEKLYVNIPVIVVPKEIFLNKSYRPSEKRVTA